MSETAELKKIKKVYGENFMKLCKELFPTLLEHEGLLYRILSSTFAGNSRTLYEDIVNKKLEAKFKDYIYSKIDIERLKNKEREEKTPYELLNNVGYDLFECKTEEQIQKFKKYYSKGEELCTFIGRRLDSHIVFWAVKKEADDIKREDFQNPKREDEYGTSVMGIQFNRYGICTVSIKNRYNHRVNNPDATYGNDLDRIVPGLTKSFENLLLQRGLKLNNLNIEEIDIPNYTKANDGKYYRYNMEVNGIYYCPNNIVIEAGEAKKVGSPEKQILIDNFILDIEHKKLQQYNDKVKDSFTEGLRQIEKIEIIKAKENKSKVIKVWIKNQEDMALIEIDKNNQIIAYKNNQLEEVEDSFLYENRALKRLELLNLKIVGDNFLSKNESLKELNLPQLRKVENSFLDNNEILIKISLPNLKEVGNNFLFRNEAILELDLLNLEKVSHGFLFSNRKLNKLNLPNLKKVRDNFLYNNKGLNKLNLTNLIELGDSFLYRNEMLEELELPMVKRIGSYFLDSNESLKKLNLTNLEVIGNNFISFNNGMEQLQMPNLTKIGNNFLDSNEEIVELNLQNVKEVGNNFLYNNRKLGKLNLPNLEIAGDSFLYCNGELQKLNLPNLKKAGNNFLFRNNAIVELELPRLPKFRYRLLSIIEKNLRKRNSITRKDIAQLDKNTEITTSEISLARKNIERIRHLTFIR